MTPEPETPCGLCGHRAGGHYAEPATGMFGDTVVMRGCNHWECRCAGFVPEGGAK